MNLSRKLSQTQCDNVTVFFKPIPCINPARSQFFKLKDCCIQMYSIAIKWIEIINLDNTKLISLFSMEKKLELIIEWVSWFKHHLQLLYNQQGGTQVTHKKRKIIVTNVTTMLTHVCSANQPSTYICIVAICWPLNPYVTKKCLAGGLKSSVKNGPLNF